MTESEQRRFEVILEDNSGKFSLVLEGHQVIRKEIHEQFDEVRRKQELFESLLKSLHDSLDRKIEGVHEELKGEIRAVGKKVEGHEARIAGLEQKAA